MENIQQKKLKVARLSIISNTALTIGKLWAGLAMGSAAVISEAIHSGLDLVAAIIAFLAVRQSGKPADEDHPYGHGKFENLASIVEALLILAAALGIFIQSVPRLFQGGGEIHSLGLGAVVMIISALVNTFISKILIKTGQETESPALIADGWHLRTDVYTSLGVLVGLGAIHLTGYTILDPIIAIVVGLLIIKAAVDLIRNSMGSMLDSSLPSEEEEVIKRVLAGYSGQFIEYHGLRTRKAGQYRHVDLHLVVPRHIPVGEAHKLCDKIEAEIEGSLPRVHMLIHCEPCEAVKEPKEARCTSSSCGMDGQGCPEGRCPISDSKRENRP